MAYFSTRKLMFILVIIYDNKYKSQSSVTKQKPNKREVPGIIHICLYFYKSGGSFNSLKKKRILIFRNENDVISFRNTVPRSRKCFLLAKIRHSFFPKNTKLTFKFFNSEISTIESIIFIKN